MFWSKKKVGEQTRPEDDGPAPQAVDGVGRTLRRARESYDQDLGRIAQALRIKRSYLDAIEKGFHDRLPGNAYAVGFVRSYAEFLGLDGDRLASDFRREVEGYHHDSNLSFLAPTPESKVPGGTVFLASAVVALLAYGAWYYLSKEDEGFVQLVPEVPERLQNQLSEEEERLEAELKQEVAAVAMGESFGPAPLVEEQIEPTTPLPNLLPDDFDPNEITTEELEALLSDAPQSTPADDAPANTPNMTELPFSTVAETTEAEPAVAAPEDQYLVEDQGESLGGTDLESTTMEIALAEEALFAEPEPPGIPIIDDPTALPREVEATATALQGETQQATANPDAVDPSEPAAEAVVPPNQGTAPIPLPPTGSSLQDLTFGHEPQSYGEGEAEVRIVLRATMDCWVQVRDEEGSLLLTRVLRPGDSYHVPDQPGLTLLAGNAGGLEITVDGITIPPLGPVGAVRREVPLDPGRLRNGTAQAL